MSEVARPAQVPTLNFYKLTVLLAGLGLVLTLGACGKRAGKIDPPPGTVDDTFPRVYPDPKTDPGGALPALPVPRPGTESGAESGTQPSTGALLPSSSEALPSGSDTLPANTRPLPSTFGPSP